MVYVYVLKSRADGNVYTGFTKDLKRRLQQHSEGLNRSTASRRPLDLVYYEGYTSEKDARMREIFLKTGRGHEVLYKQLANTLNK